MSFTVKPSGDIVCDTAEEAMELARRLRGQPPAARPVVGDSVTTERWRDVHENDKRSQATIAEYKAGAHWFDRLSAGQRECIELRIAGMWPHEIAAKLHKTIGAVHNRLDKGRKQLAKFRAREAAWIARETTEPNPVGAPFGGGGVKRMPKGKWRWHFRVDGDAHYGPTVATEEEAFDGLDAKLKELAPMHPKIARLLRDVSEAVGDDGAGAPPSAPSSPPPPDSEPPPAASKKRCAKCGELGHNSRRHSRDAEPPAAAHLPTPAAPPPAAARLYVVSEDFEEEDGTAWIEGDVWEATEPTGETLEEHAQWNMRRQGDGAEGVGFPSLHPFVPHDARASGRPLDNITIPRVGMGPKQADAAA